MRGQAGWMRGQRWQLSAQSIVKRTAHAFAWMGMAGHLGHSSQPQTYYLNGTPLGSVNRGASAATDEARVLARR